MNNRCTILLVDGSDAAQTLYRCYLAEDSRYNYEIVGFKTGEQALEWCQQRTAAAILLDHVLPDMTGLQFLDALKQHDRALPTLMLTDNSSEAIAVELMKRGVQEYIPENKVTGEGLRRAIHATIERSQLTQELAQQQEQQRLIATIALHIRQSLDLSKILNTAVEEVRSLLQADRVVVCQFLTENQGTIVAESVLPAWTPLLHTSIDTTQLQHNGGSPTSPIEARATNDIDASALTDDYVQFLKNFQIQARVVIPIQSGQPEADTAPQLDGSTDNLRPWGWLMVHQCTAPRQWHPLELELLHQLATQLEIAIRQAELYHSVQALNANLEEKVQQRTLKLQQVNEQLKKEVTTRRKIQEALQESQVCLSLIAAVTTSRNTLHTTDAAIEFVVSLIHHFFPTLRVHYCTIDAHDQLETRLSLQPEPQFDCTGMRLDLQQVPDYLASLRTGQPLTASDVQQDSRLRPILHHLQELNIRAMLTVPLKHSENCLGAISISSDQVHRWNQYEVQALVEISGFLSTTLHSIALQEQQVLAEQALQESERKFRAIFNNTFQFTGLLTPAGVLLEANQSILDFGGIPRETVINRPLWESDWWAIAPETQQQLQQAVAQAAAGSFVRYEAEILGKNRIQRTIDFSLRPLKDESDQVVLLIAEGRDISDRKRVEQERDRLLSALEQHNQTLEEQVAQRTEALQKSEEMFRQLAENIDSVLWIISLDRAERIYVSPAYEKIWGRSSQELHITPNSWVNSIHPDDRERVMAALPKQLCGAYDEEYRIIQPGGEIRWIHDRAFPIHDDQGTIYRIAGIAEDVTQRKSAERKIKYQAGRELLLREISQRIRQSLDLQTIFDTACQEIRQVLQSDRVGIFKFYPESNYNDGEFVAESVLEDISSIVSFRVHDHCFGENYAIQYSQGRYFASEDIYKGLNSCHSRILAQFQVRANLVIPLLCGNALWGLLCIHQCRSTRQWQESEIDLGQQLANQLAIAIQQATLYEQVQLELQVRQQAEAKIAQQLRQQKALGTIIQHIRDSLSLNEILNTVTQQIKDILLGDRVIIFRLFPDGRSQIVEEAVSEEFPSLKNRHWDNEVWSQNILDLYWKGQPRIVADVMDDTWTGCLVDYSREGHIQSKIVAPILQEVQTGEQHRWVAPGETNKLWGVVVVHACREKRVWQEPEAQLLQQIANQLAIAIQQAQLFEQLQQELTERQQTQYQLTERNQQLAISNEELARATRLKDEFLANMSHELRTPLNAILGMTEGLQDEVFGTINTQQSKSLRTIESSANHLLSLINDILDVSKIESGQMELEYASVAVAPLCASSLAFIKQQALKKGIQLETHLPANLPNLWVDERRLRQVLINLLTNAVKFTLAGGKISLQVSPKTRTGSSPDSLQISITDTGIGIAQEYIPKLFQPFVQIDSALNRKYQGTGLGLALVKKIVELHGGEVGLTSELGAGSCFTIELPLNSESALAADQTVEIPTTDFSAICASSDQDTPPGSPQILLAEDNEANISTITSYLGAKGYQILLAHNGHEAVAIAQAQRPALILMDIQMPEMDGLEAIKLIRQNPDLLQTPIIALTALAMAGDYERCIAAGADAYMAKPIRLRRLAELISRLLHPPTHSKDSPSCKD